MFNRKLRACGVFLGALLPLAAQAGLITQAPGNPDRANVSFANHPDQEITLGPVGLTASDGTEVRYSATNSDGLAGFSADIFTLGNNGAWRNDGYTYAWVNGGERGGIGSTLRFNFLSGPVASVGGVINYVLDVNDPNFDPALFAIKALAQDGSVLEVFHLENLAPIRTSGLINAGAFRGIGRNAADIYAFEIQGGGVLQSLEFSATVAPLAIPEPATALLLLSGLAAWSTTRRRNKA